MRYREADEGDAGVVAALHADSWRRTYRGAYPDDFLDGNVGEERGQVWRDRLASPTPDQFVLLAEDDAGLVGFVCAFGAEDGEWGTLLDNLHVATRGRGQGIGARLVSETGGWCRDRHPECGLYLWVLEQNDHARNFYQRMGAVDHGGATFEAPGGGEIQSRRYGWRKLEDVAWIALEDGERV